MVCVKCKAELADNAIFCHICGKKQVTQKKRKQKRPNSMGTISKVDGRDKPYMVRLSRNINIKRPVVGYFKTPQEAEEALRLASGAKKPDKINLKLNDLWEYFLESEYFSQLSASGQNRHKTAWKRLEPIKSVKVSDITTATFQDIVSNMTYVKNIQPKGSNGAEKKKTVILECKRETKAKVRNLASLLCKEAMRLGTMNINYGALVQLPKADSKEGVPFSLADQKRLWDISETDDTAKIILIMCNIGTRPSELFLLDIEDLHLGPPDYFIGGIKTEAGMNRIIPVPPIVMPFVLHFKGDRKSGALFVGERGARLTLSNWRKRQFNVLRDNMKMNPDYTPKSGRHTFSTMGKRMGQTPETMMAVMGHEDYSTTAEKYNHITDDDILQLYNAFKNIEKPL